MSSKAEIDAVARILSKGCWDGCEDDGEIAPCTYPPCPCRTTAAIILATAEVIRGEEKKKTCRHDSKRGTGMVSTDGASRYDWYCPECGTSGHSETPARATPDPVRVW